MVNKKPKLCAVCKVEIPKGLRKYCSPKCELEAKKVRDKAKKLQIKKDNAIEVEGKIIRWGYKRWKKETWDMFSKFIRLRDSDNNGICHCITCDTEVGYWKKFHAGHFIGGRGNAVLFDEELVNAQGYNCNINLHGNYGAYTLKYLKRGYSISDIEEMQSRANKVVKYTIQDLQEKYLYYKDLVSKLLIEKGLD